MDKTTMDNVSNNAFNHAANTDAMDDLRAIRQIMARTQRMAGGEGGWFMVLWGVIWLLGFTGSQFLPDAWSGWIWMGLNGIGLTATVGLALWQQRRSGIQSPMWRTVLLWWLSLMIFDALLIFLLGLHTSRDVLLVMILSIALGYVQFGLFSHPLITYTGMVFAALAVLTTLFAPAYFYLAMALVGGGTLFGSGIWMLRRGA